MNVFSYFWAAPTTAFGIVIVGFTAATGGTVYVLGGIIEAHGGFATTFLRYVTGLALRGGAGAMTLGHVVIGRDQDCLDRTRAHERIHVKQCEKWGPLFIPAYLIASAWAWLLGKDAYRANRFEREAFRAEERPDVVPGAQWIPPIAGFHRTMTRDEIATDRSEKSSGLI